MKKQILLFFILCFSSFLKAQNFNTNGIFTGATVSAPFVADFSSTTSWVQPLPVSGLTGNLTQSGNIAFVNCILQNRTPSGGTTSQTLRTNGTTSIVYLPKMNSVGKVIIEGYVAGTQSFSIQRWDGSTWSTVSARTFPTPTWGTVEVNVNSDEPVQLRYTQTSGAFMSIRKISITEYSNTPTLITGQMFTSAQVIENLNNVTIENCIFRNMVASPALLINNCKNVIVRNCTIDNITSPVAGGHALKINNFSDVLLDNVTIKNHRSPSGHSSALNIDGATSKNITVQNCKIYDVDGGGIVTEGSSTVDVEPWKSTHDKPIPGVKILNNLIYNTGLSPDDSELQNSPKHGMYIKAWDSLIEGNVVYNCYDGQCISIRSTGIVRGNTCYNARTGPFSYWPQKPAGPSGKLIVENNVFYQTQNVRGPNDVRPISTDIRVLAINPWNTSSGLKFDDFTVRFNTVIAYNAVTTASTWPAVYVGNNYNNIKLYGNHIVDLRTSTNTPKYISHWLSSTATNFLAKNSSNYTASNLASFVDGANFDFHLSSSSGAINFANSETDFPAKDIEGKTRSAGSLDAGAYSAIRATGLKVANLTNTLLIDSTHQLTATITPANATNQEVTWSSSSPAIATVSSTGLVTAKACGTATITATTAEGGFTARSAITVTQPVTAISLSNSATIFTVAGSTEQLAPALTPANACDSVVTWSSSQSAIATVSGTGLVTAIANGTAIITASSGSVSTTYSAIVAIPTIADASRCGAGSLTLSATVPAGLSVKWYTSPTETTAVATGSGYAPTVSGTTTFYVAVSTGSLESSQRIPLTAVVNPIPTVSAPGVDRLGAGVVSLSASATGASRVSWYEAPGSPVSLATGGTFQTDTLRQTRYFYVSAQDTLTGCRSAGVPVRVSISYDLMSGQVPGSVYRNRPSELGMLFRPLVNGKVTRIRYLRLEGDTGYHAGKLWDARQKVLLAQTGDIPQTSGPARAATGWIRFATAGDSVWGIWEEVSLPTALSVVAGKEYLVSVNAQSWPFSTWGLAFSLGTPYLQTVGERSQNPTNNGLNRYYGAGFVYTGSTAPVYPDQSYAYTNYFRDVVFETDTAVAPGSYRLLTAERPVSTGSDGIYELGMRFKALRTGRITRLRYFRLQSDQTYHRGKIWEADSKRLLAETGEIPNTQSEPTAANGWTNLTGKYENGIWGIWEEITLPSPLVVSAGMEYVVSVNAGKPYPYTSEGLSGGLTNGMVSSVGGGLFYKYGNTFTYGSQTVGRYPESVSGSSNYFRDIVVEPLSSASMPGSRLSGDVSGRDLGERTAESASLRLEVYPNPVQGGDLVVRFGVGSGLAATEVRLRLYDQQGRVVGWVYEGRSGGDHQVSHPVSHLADGFYLLRLEAGHQQLIKKVLIAH